MDESVANEREGLYLNYAIRLHFVRLQSRAFKERLDIVVSMS